MDLPFHKELDDLSFSIDRCEISENGARIVWSWKFVGQRRRRRSGNIAFASEREAGSGECVIEEVIIPVNWEQDILEFPFSLRNCLIHCFAEMLSNGEKECFVGLPGYYWPLQRITDEEYEQLSYSRRILREHGEFETLFAIVLESYEEFRIALIGEIAEQTMFFRKRRVSISDVENIARNMRRFSRLTITFLSLFRMYWHKLKSDAKDNIPFYYKNKPFRREIKKAIEAADPGVIKDIEYIALGLANLSLHAKPPIDTWHSNRSRNADIFREWERIEIYFGYLQDSRIEKLRTEGKNILKAKESDNVVKHIDEGMFALQTMHFAVRSKLQKYVECARAVISGAIEKYVAEFGIPKEDEPENNFTLYKHWRGLKNQHCEDEYIGMRWDKVTEELAGEHNKLRNISKLEIINPRDQQMFDGYIFVLAGRSPYKKQLEKDIYDRGGEIRQRLSSRTTFLIAGEGLSAAMMSEASKLKKFIINIDDFAMLIKESNTDYRRFSINLQFLSPAQQMEDLFLKFGLIDAVERGIYNYRASQ